LNSFGIKGGVGSKKEEENGTGNGSIPEADTIVSSVKQLIMMAMPRQYIMTVG
jgi:hypothetical protein